MATKSLEWLVEEYGLQLCRTHPQLKNRKMVHGDSQQKAESNCLVFTATKGADRLDGPGVSDVVLEVMYRSSTGSPTQNQMVADAIDTCFSLRYVTRGMTIVEEQFGWLGIEDQEKTSSRDDGSSQRKWTFRIPFIAKLK